MMCSSLSTDASESDECPLDLRTNSCQWVNGKLKPPVAKAVLCACTIALCVLLLQEADSRKTTGLCTASLGDLGGEQKASIIACGTDNRPLRVKCLKGVKIITQAGCRLTGKLFDTPRRCWGDTCADCPSPKGADSSEFLCRKRRGVKLPSLYQISATQCVVWAKSFLCILAVFASFALCIDKADFSLTIDRCRSVNLCASVLLKVDTWSFLSHVFASFRHSCCAKKPPFDHGNLIMWKSPRQHMRSRANVKRGFECYSARDLPLVWF